jgi:hypothetical protein
MELLYSLYSRDGVGGCGLRSINREKNSSLHDRGANALFVVPKRKGQAAATFV